MLDTGYISTGYLRALFLDHWLFLLYINDLPDTFQSTPILFADDTCLHLHGSKPEVLHIKLSCEISLVQEWCHANTLTINSQKCHMLFLSPKTNDCIQEFAVSFNDTLISTEKSACYKLEFI